MEFYSKDFYKNIWKPFIVYLLLICSISGKRCGYRLYSHDHKWHAHAYKHHEPTEVGVKDCTWGCCWDQKDDVCCPFPMEIFVVGFISFICLIIVIAVSISLIKCLLSRMRKNSQHGAFCAHGNLTALVYPCPSSMPQQTYIRLDTAATQPDMNQNEDSALCATSSHVKWTSEDKQSDCLILVQ